MNLPRSQPHGRPFYRIVPLLVLALSTTAWAQTAPPAGTCAPRHIATLPGSHQFTADFLEAIATDPLASPRRADHIWALNADLDTSLPERDRTIYLSRSTDGGRTWRVVARLPHEDYNSKISEGLRNGLAVAPGGRDFVVTTQNGAFQIALPNRTRHSGERDPLIRHLPGPIEQPQEMPPFPIPKKPGEPIRAGVVKMTADGRHLIVAYGYFDLDPQLYRYHRTRVGAPWIMDGILAPMPTNLDIFSMSFDRPASAYPRSLYVGTGDQAYRLDLRTKKWTQIEGVGDDSAIHSMTVVGGLHLAACWGVYEPAGQDVEARVTDATFLLHPNKDEAGPNIRAYDVQVDPLHPNRQVVAAITGVYTSNDRGQTWHRVNGLPAGEFHTAHFSPDGTVLVSGMIGTWIVNPFADSCKPELRIRK